MTDKSAAQRVEEAVGFRVHDEGCSVERPSTTQGGTRIQYPTDLSANAIWKLYRHCISECERADRAEAEVERLKKERDELYGIAMVAAEQTGMWPYLKLNSMPLPEIKNNISRILIAKNNALMEQEEKYPNLDANFLAAMNEIGQYGFDKYAEHSFQHKRLTGDRTRHMERIYPDVLSLHASEHFEMYLRGEIHDHFKTLKHQLAAVAFNAMMEYYFAGVDEIPAPPSNGKDKSNG